MNAERLLAQFERISEAPDAIARLRRFILDLAVRGKLVEQDPEDEPAEELLEKAAADISNYQTKFNIRSHKTQERTEAASTFSLPQGWQWTQPFRIFRSITDGDHQAPPRSPEGIPFLVIGDVRDRSINYEVDRFVPEAYYDLILIERRPVKGDLLYTLVGSYGIPVIVREDKPFCVQRHIGILRPSSFASVEFLALLMDSMLVYEQVSNIATGIAQKTVPLGGLRKLLIPLPPLAEQRRFVAKVDELMALCDQLEAARQQRQQCRGRLVAATLQHLNRPSEDPASFRNDASIALQVLPSLTTTPAQIKQLRQTILNLAVRGKLVEQDPEDIDERNFFRLAPQAKTCDLIPRSWLYVPLAELLSEDTRNGYSRKPDDAVDGVPILRISAGTARPDGLVAEEEFKLISGIDDKLLGQYEVRTGDLLACRFNGNKAYVGRLSLFSGYLHQRFIYPDKLIRIRLAEELAEPSFLRWISGADLVREEVEIKCATTVGNWGISAGKLKTCLVPLPPLAEQHRIVAKVDELMALCDQLEQQLSQADQQRRRLLEAVLAEALLEPEKTLEAVYA